MARRKGLWYALEPEDVAGSVAQATGVAGLSIEDATGGDVLLTASRVLPRRHPDPLRESVRRPATAAGDGSKRARDLDILHPSGLTVSLGPDIDDGRARQDQTRRALEDALGCERMLATRPGDMARRRSLDGSLRQ
jgi:hypothetical protein